MTEKKRCDWCLGNDIYIEYHDKVWGVPVRNDKTMFEFLTLESFQAGLSWITILRKKENFQNAFDNFDFHKIAHYTESKVEELMHDEGIVRNRKKIEATINNAQRFMEVQEEFGTFCDYIWAFVDNQPIVNQLQKLSDAPAKTALSDTISKDLKKRGFKFLGSTTVYAHMQATGMVNDHLVDCFRYKEIIDEYC